MLKNLFNFKKLMNPKKPMDFVKLLALIVVGYFAVKYVLRLINREGFSVSDGEKAFVFVHMNGCGHCDNLMPTWDKVTSENNNDQSSKVKMFKYENVSTEGKKLVNDHSIKGFPGLILLDSNGSKLKEYTNSDRSEESLKAFIKENQ
tara:strand:- start:849 stop:1289 length:441 start_codon:yes stop_codon:yes gene_type:complete